MYGHPVVTYINHTSNVKFHIIIKAEFFLQLEGSQADIYSVSMEPSTGDLQPREKLEITVNFTAHRTVSV